MLSINSFVTSSPLDAKSDLISLRSKCPSLLISKSLNFYFIYETLTFSNLINSSNFTSFNYLKTRDEECLHYALNNSINVLYTFFDIISTSITLS